MQREREVNAYGGKTLIEDYDLDVETIPCEPGAEEFAAIVHLNVDISPEGA